MYLGRVVLLCLGLEEDFSFDTSMFTPYENCPFQQFRQLKNKTKNTQTSSSLRLL